MEYLNSVDTQLFLLLNSYHNDFLDQVMYWFSDRFFWVPLYLFLIFLIVKTYKLKGLLMILFIGIVIALCDQTASHLLKNLVQRLRPSHEPSLKTLIYISKAGPGGLYGFVSSHAANSFGLATFLYFALDNRFKSLKYILLIWAAIVSYSRIYNGVHYPGDVIVGGLIGCLYGYLLAKAFLSERVNRLFSKKQVIQE